MIYRNKVDPDYLCKLIRGRNVVAITPSRWGVPVGREFGIDFDRWIPCSFNEYLKKL